jgi:hypothetical protein
VTRRQLFAVAAAITWFGVLLGFILNVFDVYPEAEVDPFTYGNNGDGLSGLIGRTIDFFSFFTYLSNIIVGIVMTMLARNPDRKGAVFATLRMDSLVMISITGLVYAIVLAPDADPQGWQIISNAITHYIVPILTLVVWLIAGPRGLFRFWTVLTALIIPLTWAAYAMIRGAFINAYPYNFLNVAELGLGTALVNLGGITVLGIVLGIIYWAIDRVLSRRSALSSG